MTGGKRYATARVAGRSAPAAEPAERRRALIDAIAAHDTIDLAAAMPRRISLDHDAALLGRCYGISLQLWRDVDRSALAAVTSRLIRSGRLAGADAALFKDVRARAKQLRFLYATAGAGHGYPPLLDRLTRLMGQAQDAGRAGHRRRAALRALPIRAMVSRIGFALVSREVEALVLTDRKAFRRHLCAEFATLRQVLARPAITDRQFHDTRKIVSRLVAFYDTLAVLAPSDEHRAVDRYLATINGLMGTLHDEMVLRRSRSRRDYRRVAKPLPPAIAARLQRLADAFTASEPDG